MTHDTKGVRLAVSLSHIGAMPGATGLATLLDLAVTADEAGVDQIVLSEHVVLPAVIDGHPGARPGDPPTRFPFPSDEEYPDPLVALAAIAAVTHRARLSTNILIAPLRPAVLLAKMAATVDALSGGRLDLGVGVGWQRDEFRSLGVPFDGVGRRLEETIQACRALWAGGPSTFDGATVSFTDMFCSPTPARASIPVWFGGTANPTTARRVAELGDGWSPIGSTAPDDVAAGVRLIHEHCRRIGRDPTEIAVRCSLPMLPADDSRSAVQQTVAGAGTLIDAGATVVQLPSLDRFVDHTSEVGPVLKEAVAALPGRR